jgi:hypothetical protein
MRGIHRKRFRGRIATIERPDLELDVELWIEERALTIARKDKPLASWPIELVEIDRVGSARFVITLDGEHSAFIARDPIAFSYEGLKAIMTAKDKTRKRRIRRRKDPVPSLQAILVARVQGLEPPTAPEQHSPPAAPVETFQPLPSPANVSPSPQQSVPRAAVVAKPKVVAPPADPYERVAHIVEAPEPVKPAAAVPGTRRNPGVLDRVRAARSGLIHEHVYTEHQASAGLIRRVCNECGNVSIDISE